MVKVFFVLPGIPGPGQGCDVCTIETGLAELAGLVEGLPLRFYAAPPRFTEDGNDGPPDHTRLPKHVVAYVSADELGGVFTREGFYHLVGMSPEVARRRLGLAVA